jgi:protease I
MQEKRLDGMRVAIIVTEDFEQVEMTEPRQTLEQAGAKTTLISPKQGQVRAMNHDDKSDSFNVDLPLNQAKDTDFDAVFLPGGALNADKLRREPQAQDFVRRMDETDRPIAAICHAPWLLIDAGIASGRTLTSYYTLQNDLRNAGAHWLDVEMVRDRNWVSSRRPGDLPAFNRGMIELFAEYWQQVHYRKAA